jgi:hypothetical protein
LPRGGDQSGGGEGGFFIIYNSIYTKLKLCKFNKIGVYLCTTWIVISYV